MVYRLWLLACVLILVGAPDLALARDDAPGSQIRYIDELKQRNAAYGPGCNGIGISTPRAVNMPAGISTRWAAGHSACIPGLRLVMACIGEVANDNRVVGCTLRVAEGEAAGAIDCARMTLITPRARVKPDPPLSVALARGSRGASRPCSEPAAFAPGTTVAAAFLLPARESAGDLALLIEVDGSEVPAFLIPASQVGAATAAGS